MPCTHCRSSGLTFLRSSPHTKTSICYALHSLQVVRFDVFDTLSLYKNVNSLCLALIAGRPFDVFEVLSPCKNVNSLCPWTSVIIKRTRAGADRPALGPDDCGLLCTVFPVLAARPFNLLLFESEEVFYSVLLIDESVVLDDSVFVQLLIIL